ncbi:MAG TPA: hypothetical protein VEB20_15005 [Azospirillaceae bacterium]|nr:hypothetical protein [Azospirillaceae bacterium]
MPFMDRESFIRLLDRLGDPDDAAALAAAREVDARMRAAGISWDALLVPPPGSAAADLGGDADGETGDFEPLPPAEGEDDAALIDRMLATYPLSDTTRQELVDLKGDIAAGEFTPADGKYVRDLAARLARRG